MTHGRVMGIDFGMARIGTALSDPLGMLATGLETLRWDGEDPEWVLSRIVELCETHDVRELVVGNPRRTDGKGQSDVAAEADRFVEALEARLDIPIHRLDERFTTVIAARHLRESRSKRRTKDVIDQAAAEVILQDYLERQRM